MPWLVLGLVIFLGVHSTRIVADDWRAGRIARHGLNAWKGPYAILSIIGFVLIVYGYGAARGAPVIVWTPPAWTRHVVPVLMLVSFVLLTAAYVPGNRIKAAIGHPMVAGVKTWAFAHLLANGTLADIVLFGSFLAWAIADFVAARRRDRRAGTVYRRGPAASDVKVVAAGLVAWLAFLLFLHQWLIGVRPY